MMDTPAGYLIAALLLGLATRRVCRLVATDSIFDGPRQRFLARFPVANAMGLDWTRFRWFPAQDFAGVPEEQRPKLAGRLHGRHGYWQMTSLPMPEDDGEGGIVLPVFSWDGNHEGSMPRLHYPPRPPAWIAKLIMCGWCLSVWVGTALVVAWFHAFGLLRWDHWVELLVTSLATWQVAGLTMAVESRLSE